MPKIPTIQQVRPASRVGAPRMNANAFRPGRVSDEAVGAAGRAKAEGLQAEAQRHGLAAQAAKLSFDARDKAFQTEIAKAREEESVKQAEAASARALSDTFTMVSEFGASVAKVGQMLFEGEQESIASRGTVALREALKKAVQDYQESPDARDLPGTIETLSQAVKKKWMDKLQGKAAMRFGTNADNIALGVYVDARRIERERTLKRTDIEDKMYRQRWKAQWASTDPVARKHMRDELLLHDKALYDAGLISSETFAARALDTDLWIGKQQVIEVIQQNPKRAYDALSYMRDHPRGTPGKAPEHLRDITTQAARLGPEERNKLLDSAKARWRQGVDDAEKKQRWARQRERWAKEDRADQLGEGLYKGEASFDQVEQARARGDITVSGYNALKTFNATMYDFPPNPRAYEVAYMEIITGRATMGSIASTPVPAEDRIKLQAIRTGFAKENHYSKSPTFNQGLGIVKTGLGFPPNQLSYGAVDSQKANRLNAAILEFNRRCAAGADPLAAADLVVAQFQSMNATDFSQPTFRYGTWKDPMSAMRKTRDAYDKGDIPYRTFINESEKILIEMRRQERVGLYKPRPKPKPSGGGERNAETYR